MKREEEEESVINQHLSNGMFIQPIIYMLYICRSYTFINRDRTKKENKTLNFFLTLKR